MDKTTARAAAAAAFGQEPCPCGAAVFFVDLDYSQQLIIRYPTPREVNNVSAFVTEKLEGDEEPWLTIGLPISTSIMDRADLEKPMELVDHTWDQYLGQPMVQKVPGTCVLVACTVCVEAVHRLQHEKLHGKGTTTTFPFPYRAAPPSDLLEACRIDGVWKPGVGAYVRDVLIEICVMGGVPATTDRPTPAKCLLPLHSSQEHRWDDGSAAGGLSPERVAGLLYNNGPCVGVLWVISPWYQRIDADQDDEKVYTTGGCGRSDDIRRLSEDLFHGHQVGWHAVVCFGYRFRDGQMHVLVLDNHTPTGPRRWIHVKELHTLYTLTGGDCQVTSNSSGGLPSH